MMPVTPEADPPGLIFTFEIAMGVRKGNTNLQAALNTALSRHHTEIQAILTNYGVPLLPIPAPSKATD